MNSIVKYIGGCMGIAFVTASFGQTNAELLKYGNHAFKTKNYSNSAFFLGEYIKKATTGSSETAYPYEFLSWDPKVKEIEEDSAKLNQPIDSNSINSDVKLNWNHNFQVALYMLGLSYYLAPNYTKAEETLKQCKELDMQLYPHSQYWYALSLISNMKYTKAQRELREYTDRISAQEKRDSLSSSYLTNAEYLIFSCKWAKANASKPVNGVSVQIADSILNGSTSQFAVSFLKNEQNILFASLTNDVKVNNNSYDIYTSKRKDSTNWENKTRYSNIINSVFHEGTPFVSKDGTKLFFTRWENSQEAMECSIYLSRFYNGQWLQPQKLAEEVNLLGFKSMHPFLSDDGSILYFSSNRPGGKGKMDIWYCSIDEYGKVGSPINAGGAINTSEDDGSPFYSETTETLFFSSKGHIGMGGVDIFQAYGTFGNFHQPENLGFPINTGRDEQHFILNAKENYGFLSSDRVECTECEGGTACHSIFEVEYDPPKFTLSGHVYSLLNNKPIANSLITYKGGFVEPFFIITDENGYYFSRLRRETSYDVKAQKVRYFADAKKVSTIGLDKSSNMVHDFFLPLIPVGEIEIKGIFYDYDKWELRQESKMTLDTLVYFLNINNNIVIELSSHTDSRGADQYNMDLSQKRAQSVVDYLIYKGIKNGRLKPTGYGETKPRMENAESEEDHQQNRRTAFKVIGEDFIELKE